MISLPLPDPSSPPRISPPPIPAYFDPRANAQAHAWDSTRKHLDVAAALSARPGLAELRVSPALTREQVLLAHAERYVAAVEAGTPLGLAQSNDFTWCAEVDPAARAAGGQLLGAARAALAGPLRVAGAVASGFHHAEWDRGMGFCTYNGLVIAARVLAREGLVRRVMILDLDQHRGNGQDEIAGRLGLGSLIRHLGLPAAPDEATYFRRLGSYLGELGRDQERGGGADLVLYQAGMDPHEDDLLGGVPGMTAALLRERDERVFQACRDAGVPVAFCLAGGYSGAYSGGGGQALNPVVGLHVGSFEAAQAVYGKQA